MKLIHQARDNPNIIELNWMWLPVFIGQNNSLLRALHHDLMAEFKEQEITPEILDQLHEYVIQWLCSRVPVKGLDLYLRGVEGIDQ
jgi:hypothetical protein